MSGQAIGQMKDNTASTADRVAERTIACHPCRERLARSIEELHALSRRGLWGLILFLSLSALALWLSQPETAALVPAAVRELLGPPPPVELLHVVLGGSWFSAFVMILGRRGADGRPGYSWSNIGLPAAFYPLYIFAEPSGTCFPVVFAAGLVLLLLEHGLALRYTTREIRKASARMKSMPH